MSNVSISKVLFIEENEPGSQAPVTVELNPKKQTLIYVNDKGKAKKIDAVSTVFSEEGGAGNIPLLVTLPRGFVFESPYISTELPNFDECVKVEPQDDDTVLCLTFIEPPVGVSHTFPHVLFHIQGQDPIDPAINIRRRPG